MRWPLRETVLNRQAVASARWNWPLKPWLSADSPCLSTYLFSFPDTYVKQQRPDLRAHESGNFSTAQPPVWPKARFLLEQRPADLDRSQKQRRCVGEGAGH